MPRQDCFEIDYSLGRPALFSNGAHCVGTKNDSGAEQIVAKSNFLLQLFLWWPFFSFSPFFFFSPLPFRCLSRHLGRGSRAETGVHRGSVPPLVIVCDVHTASSHRAPAPEGLHSRYRRSLPMLRLPQGPVIVLLFSSLSFLFCNSAQFSVSENTCSFFFFLHLLNGFELEWDLVTRCFWAFTA